nr:hypothetical protein Itr_chr06CG15320 [Ipomoea trifida]GMD03931.1 hypothetical protein Iba_chr06aCG13630 [Ipomoea batatas]
MWSYEMKQLLTDYCKIKANHQVVNNKDPHCQNGSHQNFQLNNVTLTMYQCTIMHSCIFIKKILIRKKS